MSATSGANGSASASQAQKSTRSAPGKCDRETAAVVHQADPAARIAQDPGGGSAGKAQQGKIDVDPEHQRVWMPRREIECGAPGAAADIQCAAHGRRSRQFQQPRQTATPGAGSRTIAGRGLGWIEIGPTVPGIGRKRLAHRVEPASRPDRVADQALQRRIEIVAHQQFDPALGKQRSQRRNDDRDAVDDRVFVAARRIRAVQDAVAPARSRRRVLAADGRRGRRAND